MQRLLSFVSVRCRPLCQRYLHSTNLAMLFWCSSASDSRTRSTLFCRMRMFSNFIISTAARCSPVWGCGQDSFPAIRSRAASTEITSVMHLLNSALLTDSGTRQHGCHQNVMTGTIDKRDVSDVRTSMRVTLPHQFHLVFTARTFASRVRLLVARVRLVAPGPRTRRVGALVNLHFVSLNTRSHPHRKPLRWRNPA